MKKLRSSKICAALCALCFLTACAPVQNQPVELTGEYRISAESIAGQTVDQEYPLSQETGLDAWSDGLFHELAQTDDVALYGRYSAEEDRSEVLLHGQIQALFSWDFLTPRGACVAAQSVETDGETILAVAAVVGTGTGVSVEELHFVLEDTDTQGYIDRSLKPEAYRELVGKVVRAEIGKDGVSIITEDQVLTLAEDVCGTPGKGAGIALGDQVRYELTDAGVCVILGVEYFQKSGGLPETVATLQADVLYADGVFTLCNFALEE